MSPCAWDQGIRQLDRQRLRPSVLSCDLLLNFLCPEVFWAVSLNARGNQGNCLLAAFMGEFFSVSIWQALDPGGVSGTHAGVSIPLMSLCDLIPVALSQVISQLFLSKLFFRIILREVFISALNG